MTRSVCLLLATAACMPATPEDLGTDGAQHQSALTQSALAGTWDGVDFTEEEALAVLEIVDTASEDELDHDVPLDSRAVRSILYARPVGSMSRLSGLYFVGEDALLNLRDYANFEVDEGFDTGDWSPEDELDD